MVKEFKMAENIRYFLAENKLLICYDRFISNDYDDMNQILNMTSSKHEEVCKDLGFFDIIGHRKRFLAAIRIASSKLKNQLATSTSAPAKGKEIFSECMCILYSIFFFHHSGSMCG